MKNYVTHNNEEIEMYGGALIGYVKCSYYDLVNLFGKPTYGDGYKIDSEWLIKFKDGIVVWIYDWKIGKNYNGKTNGIASYNLHDYDWHIGGDNAIGVSYIQNLVKNIKHLCYLRIINKEDLNYVRRILTKLNFKSNIPSAIRTYPVKIELIYNTVSKNKTYGLIDNPKTKLLKIEDLSNNSTIDSIIFDALI